MLSFKYVAINKSGERITGVLEAANEMEAASKIRESCPIIEKLTMVEQGKMMQANFLSADIGKLKMKDFVLMCNQFAIIMQSGLPVAKSVELIADKTENKMIKTILLKVSSDVDSGKTMADSFEEHGKKKFPTTFIETVRAGEESGNLANSFASMATYYDRQMQVKRKIKSAVSYPLFVLVIAVVVVAVLMIAVVPVFSGIFEANGGQIPAITQALIDLSNFVAKNIVWIIVVVVVIIVGYKIYNHTEKGSLQIAKLKTKLPMLGNLVGLQAASEFSSTMAIMMGSGIPMNRSVSITGRVLSNKYVSQCMNDVTERVEQGSDLAKALQETEVMPDILVNMVTVGEETGELEDTLKTISGYYGTEYELAVNKVVGKLSPMILLVTAGIAGFIVIAMYMAMFEMYNGM